MFMTLQALTKDITRKMSKGLIESILWTFEKVQATYIKQTVRCVCTFHLGCDLKKKKRFKKINTYFQDKRM